MDLCSEGHDEVCYTGRFCPACTTKEDQGRVIDDLEDKIAAYENRITELEEVIENLKELEKRTAHCTMNQPIQPPATLTILFPTQDQLLRFAGYLSDGGGEYHFFESEDDKPNPITSFDYWQDGEFLENNLIIAQDRKEEEE